MGKVVVSEFISLDGVIEDPGGAEGTEFGGWTFRFPAEEGVPSPVESRWRSWVNPRRRVGQFRCGQLGLGGRGGLGRRRGRASVCGP
jgi:hypothetical protein